MNDNGGGGTDDTTVEGLRKAGNSQFKLGNYNEAVVTYTMAIEKAKDSSVLYTNRACALLKLHEYNRVISDCQAALRNDSHNLKAHYMMGMAHLGSSNYANAVTWFRSGLRQAQIRAKDYIEDLSIQLKKAERKFAIQQQDERDTRDTMAYSFLNKVLEEAKVVGEERASKLENAATIIAEIDKDTAVARAALDDWLSLSRSLSKPHVIPDYFCCKITCELMQDPVLTPAGITYERSSLLRHFTANGYFEPCSREPITERNLIPNLSLKDAIEAWVKENAWAIEGVEDL